MRVRKMILAVAAGFCGAVSVFSLLPKFRPVCRVMDSAVKVGHGAQPTVTITLWRPTDGFLLEKSIPVSDEAVAAAFCEQWAAVKGRWVECRSVPDSIYPEVILDPAASRQIRNQNALYIVLLVVVLMSLVYVTHRAHKQAGNTREPSPPPPYEAAASVSHAPSGGAQCSSP
jgi:hypothetical protein